MAIGDAVFQSFPSVFISSTVRDFRDLRSGIAYHLRLQGFSVSVSEAADFDVQGDRSALEECFGNVRVSDYYILLLGGRRGSLFEEVISVTRQEYRTARDEFLAQGRPRMFLYLREDIEQALKSGKSVQEQAGIDDIDHLTSFLEEVQKPPSKEVPNFLTRFRDYADVMASLSGRLNIGRNVWETLTRHTLVSELSTNLGDMLHRWGNSAAGTHSLMHKVREEIDLQEISPMGQISVSEEQTNGLLLAIPGSIRGSELRTKAIEEALAQGVFLKFDPGARSFEETPLHQQLRQTLEDIKLLAKLDPQLYSDGWNSKLLVALTQGGGAAGPRSVSREDLLWAFAYYDRVENVFNGHIAICKVLLGLVDAPPTYERRPLTPLGSGEEGRLVRGKAQPQEVVRLITNEIWPFGSKFMANMLGSTHEEQVQRIADGMRESLEVFGITVELPNNFFDKAAAEFLATHPVQPEEGIEDLTHGV